MRRLIVSLLTLCAFVNCLIGCTSTSVVVMPRDELLESHNERDVILDARLRTDSVIYFYGWTVEIDSTARMVTGHSRDGIPVELKYDEISAFRVERFSKTNTALLAVGIVGVVVAFVLLYRHEAGKTKPCGWCTD